MSIVRNYIYNVVYQLTTLIIPIITVPYVSRVLGSNGIGINAYTNSIIQYFILLGTIGISLYGNREIAYVRDDKVKLTNTFWSIFYLKIITTFVAYLLFLIFLCFVDKYQSIFFIQSIYLIAAAVDISWLYMGLEDFKKTVIRNLLVKILGVIFIFIFVKDPGDLWKFVFILASSQLIGNLSLWYYLPKTVNKARITWLEVKKHLKPSISLFIPQVAIQIYVVLNKTMLGILSNPSEVGYFDNADKIVKVILSIVTAMGTVMLPRISNTFSKGDIKQVKNYVYNSFNFVSYLATPLMFGVAGIATEFAPWFFGLEFNKTGIIMCMISPIIVFIAWSNVLGNQYLMPIGKVRGYTISVTFGAVINFTLNLILISRFHSIGTAIATVVGELSVTVVQLYIVRRDLKIKELLYSTWKYFISGIIMFFIIKSIGIYLVDEIKTMIIQFTVGIFTYIILLFLLKSEVNTMFFKKCISYFRKKIKNN